MEGEKKCRLCGEMTPYSDFYKTKTVKSGIRSWCVACCKKWAREYRESNPEHTRKVKRDYYHDKDRAKQIDRVQRGRRENPEKYKARSMVSVAIKNGTLIPAPCEKCGSEQFVDSHHDDYSKPMDVRWLCRGHHQRLHANDGYKPGRPRKNIKQGE